MRNSLNFSQLQLNDVATMGNPMGVSYNGRYGPNDILIILLGKDVDNKPMGFGLSNCLSYVQTNPDVVGMYGWIQMGPSPSIAGVFQSCSHL